MSPEIFLVIQILLPAVIGGLTGLLVFWGKLSQYKEKVDQLENRISNLEKNLREAEHKLTACETRLEERDPIKKYIKRSSPITLTEAGNKLLEECGGKSIVDNNKKELVDKIKEADPKSPYDVQEEAKKVIEQFKNDPRFTVVKDYVFKNGLELSIPIQVIAVYLRDITLPDWGWDIKDIKDETKNIKSTG